MSKRTRFCWWVVLCAALVGCGTQRKYVRVDPALALLAPKDSTVLAGVNVDALRRTPWFQKAAGRQLPFLDEFAKQTGIDARKDLWELLFVSDGVHSAMLARGQFSEQGLEPKIERPGFSRTPYKSYTLNGNDEGAFTFVNPTTVAAGRPESVKFILDQRPQSDGPPAKLWQIAESIPKENQIWLAAIGALPNSNPNMARISSLVESLQAGADLRDGMKAFALGTARTDQDARTLADAVRGFLALARMGAGGNRQELLKVYDGIQVEQQGRTVRVKAALSPEAFDQALGVFR